MRRSILVLAVLIAAGPALAQRPATFAMSCGQVHAVLASRGVAVMSTGPATYDRFVADDRFCERDEFAEQQWVPTRDTPACPVARCRARSDFFWDR